MSARPKHGAFALPLLLLACAPAGSESTPNTGAGESPALVFCRASATSSSVGEVALRTARNLLTERLPDRSGRERQPRVHPDKDRVAFVRQSTPGDATTGDLYVARRSGNEPEIRLTTSSGADEDPCWSPLGGVLLFSTARNGERRLFTCAPDGTNPQPFLSASAGIEDREPDWSWSTDRIVFVRRQGSQSRLQLVNGDGTGLVPFGNARPASTPDLGIHEPCFAPDGSRVLFVDVTAAGISRLWSIDVSTGVESLLYDPQGEVRMPRFASGGARILCGIAQPLEGRQGLRLSSLDVGGADPRLVEPGEQWILHGVDSIALAPGLPNVAAIQVVPQTELQVQVSAGTVTQGGKSQLASQDNQSLVLATATFGTHEIAGINCRYTLPGASPGEIVFVRARIVARVSRSDADTTLRTSLYNPVVERFDTVAELPNPGTGMSTLTFTTQSLAHVTLERQVRVTVIGEIGAGARAELHVDHVQLEVARAATLREPAPR